MNWIRKEIGGASRSTNAASCQLYQNSMPIRPMMVSVSRISTVTELVVASATRSMLSVNRDSRSPVAACS